MQNLCRGLVALALLVAMPAAVGADAMTAPAGPPTLKLPTGARPLRYAVALTVAPGDAKAPGEIAIDVELERPHAVLWLNAESLDVTRAAVELPETRATVLAGNEQFVGHRVRAAACRPASIA